jgi:hypothetical protein
MQTKESIRVTESVRNASALYMDTAVYRERVAVKRAAVRGATDGESMERLNKKWQSL